MLGNWPDSHSGGGTGFGCGTGAGCAGLATLAGAALTGITDSSRARLFAGSAVSQLYRWKILQVTSQIDLNIIRTAEQLYSLNPFNNMQVLSCCS